LPWRSGTIGNPPFAIVPKASGWDGPGGEPKFPPRSGTERGRLVWTEEPNVETETVHGYGPRCYTCGLGIEMRYSVSGPRSKSQGYWSHQDTVAGIAADLEHHALK
jgi:hypothetical protein